MFVKHARIAASPLQIAICRAADGIAPGGVLSPDDLQSYFGVADEHAQSWARPHYVVLVCGRGGGKTTLAACACIRAAVTADFSKTQSYEQAYVYLVGPDLKNAGTAFKIISGIITTSSVLGLMLVGRITGSKLTLMRPDGRRVTIAAVAAAPLGKTVRGEHLAGMVLEEAAFFEAASKGSIITAEEQVRAGAPRLMPGAQTWIVSSPAGPAGLLYDLYQSHFGKPADHVVVHAPTLGLNPNFPRSEIDSLTAKDPDAAAREYGAQWIDAETAFLEAAVVDGATREGWEDLPYDGEATYTAAIDPATRSNAFTLVIVESKGTLHRVAKLRQWVPRKTEPLSPKAVLTEVRLILDDYAVSMALTDQWSVDAMRDIAEDLEFELEERTQTRSDKWDAYSTMKTLLQEKRLTLPKHPLLRADLLSLRKVVNNSGPSVEAPVGPGGRHADYASALALACSNLDEDQRDDRGGSIGFGAGLDELQAGD